MTFLYPHYVSDFLSFAVKATMLALIFVDDHIFVCLQETLAFTYFPDFSLISFDVTFSVVFEVLLLVFASTY